MLNKHKILIRYFFIGVSAAFIDVGVYAVLFNIFDWSVLIATTVSVSLATIDNQVKYGHLVKHKLGKSSRFKSSDLDALFINSKTV